MLYSLTHQIVKELLKRGVMTRDDVHNVKRAIAGALKLPPPPSADILDAYREMVGAQEISVDKKIEELLQVRSVRTLSGVAIITVLTKPYMCPGQCVYCPTEARMPKSYIATEPAAARALRLEFDPYEQVASRLATLERNGHPTDKIELIVKGGTWSAYRPDYQFWFISRCFAAANDFFGDSSKGDTSKFPLGTLLNAKRLEVSPLFTFRSVPFRTVPITLRTELREMQSKNETAGHRIIGITLETRPDWVHPQTIAILRELGCTRIELGLQHTDDEILKLVNRGHTLAQFKKAVRLLRAAGFKVDFHTMPQLPGATPEKDLEMYRTLFADADLRPDMIKIYPCVVTRTAEIYDWWKDGRYVPYADQELIEMLISAKQLVPRYCRISRLIRDIPSTEIYAGNVVTNLRQVVQKKMRSSGQRCLCLRCREIGHSTDFDNQSAPQFFVEEYESSGGCEFFLSFEDQERKNVFAFLRLRLPGALPDADTEKMFELLPEIRNAAFIRELHTYGHLVPLDQRLDGAANAQHRGLGRALMERAEKIVSDVGGKKIAVISGVGVREYYRKLGYAKDGTYMVKRLH
ncbi:MAG: hypothetical protein HW383_203 [Candidatus Magasanikbacteria bacterium]|nr:hypothetical protein [Candidatus Magasanikbacteria bacterium]